MQFLRFSIAGLMGAVLIAAVGLVALRFASPIWAGATLLATCGAACPRRCRRDLPRRRRAHVVARVCPVWLGVYGPRVLVAGRRCQSADFGLS